ncbi:MAG: DUF4129 domain-containing protein [Parapedobacter sp.]|nr:MAG: DUF4129 domain-containing protein [Parapedobacter sp.]
MWKCRYILWLLCCSSWLSVSAYADHAPADQTAKIVMPDSSAVTPRQFDQASLDSYKARADFQYDEQRVDLSWWQRFKQWLAYKIAELMSREGSHALLKNVLVVLGIAALLYLVIKLLGMDAAGIFSRKSRTSDLGVTEHTENIHGIDFAAELQKAMENGNYRLAVRLLYLDCLKKLSDSGLIHWQPAKTNAAYVGELEDTRVQSEFKRLTRQFEYIWYGDFGVNRQHFNQLHEAFQQFDEELK